MLPVLVAVTLSLPATGEILQVEVEGTPYEMGMQHGTALEAEVEQAITDWHAEVVEAFGEKDAERILTWVRDETEYQANLRQALPQVWEELRGIADGAGVEVEDVFLLHLYEEVYETAAQKIGLTPTRGVGQGCTAFAVQDGEQRFIGQNVDSSGNLRQRPLLVRYRGVRKAILSYTTVGRVGGIGVNGKGLALLATTLPQGRRREADGIAAPFVMRALLERESVGAAIDELARLPRSSALAYVLADPRGVLIVEASVDKMAVRKLSNERPVLVQTNHMLELGERLDFTGLFESGEPVPGMPFLSHERRLVARRKLEAARGQVDVALLRAVLTETPNNMYHPRFMTTRSAIVVYEEEDARLYLSAGYDPQRRWTEYGL